MDGRSSRTPPRRDGHQPLHLRLLGHRPYGATTDEGGGGNHPRFMAEYAPTTVLVIIAGFAAICFGSFLATIRQPQNLKTRTFQVEGVRSGRVIVVTLFSLAATIYYVSKMGISSFLKPRLDVSARLAEVFPDDTTAALVVGITSMSLLVAVVAQISLFRQRRRARLAAPLPMLIATCVILLFVVNPIGSARYAVGTVYLALLGAIGVWGTLRRYRLISILTMLALFFLFPIASTFRNSLSAQVALQNPLDSLLSGDFDSFDQINNTVYFVASRGLPGRPAVRRNFLLGATIDMARKGNRHRRSARQFPRLFVHKPLCASLGRAVHQRKLAPAYCWHDGPWFFCTPMGQEVECSNPRHRNTDPHRLHRALLSAHRARGSLLQAMASLAVVLVLSYFVTGTTRHRRKHSLDMEERARTSGRSTPSRLCRRSTGPPATRLG